MPGVHHPDLLVTLDKRSHLRNIHRHGWQASLDPDSGMFTIRRGRRTYRSLPRGTPLRRRPPPTGDPPSVN